LVLFVESQRWKARGGELELSEKRLVWLGAIKSNAGINLEIEPGSKE